MSAFLFPFSTLLVNIFNAEHLGRFFKKYPLVLHYYCVIISKCQKVTFWWSRQKNLSNGRRKKSCLKLPDLARKLIENVF